MGKSYCKWKVYSWENHRTKWGIFGIFHCHVGHVSLPEGKCHELHHAIQSSGPPPILPILPVFYAQGTLCV